MRAHAQDDAVDVVVADVVREGGHGAGVRGGEAGGGETLAAAAVAENGTKLLTGKAAAHVQTVGCARAPGDNTCAAVDDTLLSRIFVQKFGITVTLVYSFAPPPSSLSPQVAPAYLKGLIMHPTHAMRSTSPPPPVTRQPTTAYGG